MSLYKQEIINYFSSLIAKEIGIQYTSVNAHLLENRLVELSKLMGFSSLEDFWNDLKIRNLKQVEKDMVLDLATNNETSFFRDMEVFDFFGDFVSRFPQQETLRVWSAACSTGQEVYSLSMIMNERFPGKKYTILATDFSDRVLAQARSGIYSQLEVQRGLSAHRLVKNFDQLTKEDDYLPRFQIHGHFSSSIEFKKMNLLDSWPKMGPFHMIFCRNMLIYQDINRKKILVEKFGNLLFPGGYFILGGAESLIGLSSSFQSELFGKACVYKLK